MEILKILVERHIDLLREENVEITADEALGRLVAKFVGWNGRRIFHVTGFALKDAGLLAECEAMKGMAEEVPSKTLPQEDNENS